MGKKSNEELRNERLADDMNTTLDSAGWQGELERHGMGSIKPGSEPDDDQITRELDELEK